MREILFRGKPKNKSDLILVSQMKPENVLDDFVLGLLTIKDDRYFICFSTMGVSNGSLINNCISSVVEVIPETVGQYTVLTDKNGKKIFEGDIVSAHGYIGYVQMDTDYWEVHWNHDFNRKLYVWTDTVEVIGNIHDNPELLNDEEDEELNQ